MYIYLVYIYKYHPMHAIEERLLAEPGQTFVGATNSSITLKYEETRHLVTGSYLIEKIRRPNKIEAYTIIM